MRATGIAVLVILLAPVGPAQADDGKDNAAFVESVNDAIDRGVLWVVKAQAEDGSWPGYEGKYPMGPTALGLLTVLKCDYPRKSTTVKKALKLLYKRYEEQKPEKLHTYSVAILMMALEEAHAEQREERIKPGGRYARDRRLRRTHLPNAEFKWMSALARWMVSKQTESVWRYPRGGIDHSNTQYALLGLAAARRCGVQMSREPFLKAATYLLDAQEETGPPLRRIVHVDQGEGYARRYLTSEYDHARGWGYQKGGNATGSMTTAGVSSLAICRSELMDWPGYKGPFGTRMETGIKDGLAWLTAHFAVDRNPPGRSGWHFYYLFGLERAGVLTDVRFLGDHDWYHEGATYLVRDQSPQGNWAPRRRGGKAGFLDTCFALLFLRRATVPVKVPVPVTPPVPEK